MKLRNNCVVVLFFSLALAPAVCAQNVTTVAGGFVGDGRAATQASFQDPIGLVRDHSGNTYVTDASGQRIRKITGAGIISTFAGTGHAGFNGDGRQAGTAQVNSPVGITLDAAGDLVFDDFGNNRIRKVDLSGNISTIAGNGIAGYSGDNGLATLASLNAPWGDVYDAAGNLYISDFLNNVIRKVDTSGIITTYAGNGTVGYCGDGLLATSACLDSPKGLAVDAGGNLYIADALNHRVRQVSPSGIITTVAGVGTGGFSGDGGQATAAKIGNPRGVAVRGGVLYISNGGDACVRNVVLSTGVINTSVGSTPGYDGDGHVPSATQFFSNGGIVPISSTAMLVVDIGNVRLRQMSGGIVKTIAGGFIGDGNRATAAAMALPQGIAFDKAGNLYIVEFSGNRVRKVDTTGKISTVAGTGVSGYTGDGGAATAAQLYFPQAVIVDAANNLYIADQANNVIRKVDAATQNISTFSTNLNFGGGLSFMAFDASGTLYVADAGACVVWKIDSGGNATVVAGVAFTCGYNGDNIQATSAQLNSPFGVAFSAAGDMYIADTSNNRVRKVNAGGTITTFAGDGTVCLSSTSACGDGGSPTAAQFNNPLNLAFSGGAVYITDESDLRIRKVSAGIISTYAGTGIAGYNGNGLSALSTNLDDPVDVAVNPVNKALYLVDDSQARVRRVH